MILVHLHTLTLASDVSVKMKTIRREGGMASFHVGVGSSGELVRRHDSLDTKVKEEAVGNRIAKRSKPIAFQQLQRSECNTPYILGKANPNKTECFNTHHTQILTEEKCKLAAEAANATMPPNWVVTEAGGWRNIRPRGCFMMPCAHNATHHNNGREGTTSGTCYFYNPIGNDPSGPIGGTAVCEGTMFYDGTNDTNGKKVGECPDGYGTILKEDPCEEAAECLKHRLAAQTRVANLNASKYNDYPLGCLINHDDNKVYFNAPKNESDPADPTAPIGIPICKLKKITHFPADLVTARI